MDSILQAPKEEESDAEGLRVKLRGAVKKGKAIEKQRAELEAQLSSLQEQVVHIQPKSQEDRLPALVHLI